MYPNRLECFLICLTSDRWFISDKHWNMLLSHGIKRIPFLRTSVFIICFVQKLNLPLLVGDGWFFSEKTESDCSSSKVALWKMLVTTGKKNLVKESWLMVSQVCLNEHLLLYLLAWAFTLSSLRSNNSVLPSLSGYLSAWSIVFDL